MRCDAIYKYITPIYHANISNKFKDELIRLNAQFKVLMEPVKEFVDELRDNLIYKELDERNLNKELIKAMKKKVKKEVKERVVTL